MSSKSNSPFWEFGNSENLFEVNAELRTIFSFHWISQYCHNIVTCLAACNAVCPNWNFFTKTILFGILSRHGFRRISDIKNYAGFIYGFYDWNNYLLKPVSHLAKSNKYPFKKLISNPRRNFRFMPTPSEAKAENLVNSCCNTSSS